ncbi:MAG: hypothetical protein IPI25_13055 [Candidatus Brocadia sp.]|nr:MAG: hypothetical protein IPI25_13055 [Candidatus Brocadia sp.]
MNNKEYRADTQRIKADIFFFRYYEYEPRNTSDPCKITEVCRRKGKA